MKIQDAALGITPPIIPNIRGEFTANLQISSLERIYFFLPKLGIVTQKLVHNILSAYPRKASNSLYITNPIDSDTTSILELPKLFFGYNCQEQRRNMPQNKRGMPHYERGMPH